MSLTAVIPIRLGLPRKTRLSERLSSAEREALADRLFGHVFGIVSAHPQIQRTIILSHSQPAGIVADWRKDEGRGLNTELEILRRDLGEDDLLIIHGDLPLLAAADLSALIDAASAGGIAIAPDRFDQGTNAVVLRAQSSFTFAFGRGSFAAHLEESGGEAALVRRVGLALDIDSPEDLEAAKTMGFDH